MANTYEHLDIWKKSVVLTGDIYRLTSTFPKSELFGLTSQLRRASVSIPSNIAEGSSRKSKKDYARFIEISIGSLNEIESLLFVSHQLDFIDAKTLADYKLKVNEIGGLLGGFRRYLLK